MRQTLRRSLLALTCALMCGLASAQEVRIDGILYHLYSQTAMILDGSECQGDVDIPATFTCEGKEYSVTRINTAAFRYCTEITSVTIPNTVSEISHDAFAGCSNLTSVTIGNGVERIEDNTFAFCDSLSTLIIGNSVKRIDTFAFYDCGLLTTVTLPSSITFIKEMAFGGCYGLTDVYCLADNPPTMEAGGFDIFDTEITLHVPAASVEVYEKTVPWSYFKRVVEIPDVALLDGMIYNLYPSTQRAELAICGKEVEGHLDIPAEITVDGVNYAVTDIGNSAIADQDRMTSMSIPTSVIRIGEYAFNDCSSLTSVIIPNSVKVIEAGTFHECQVLESVVIGACVAVIGEYAFANCNELLSVTNLSIFPQAINPNVFEGRRPECMLYVVPGCLEAYQWASVWRDFGEIVENAELPAGGGATDIADTPRATAQPTACYTLSGVRSASPQKGISIQRMSDGSVRKIVQSK